jgi:hypothetical protein
VDAKTIATSSGTHLDFMSKSAARFWLPMRLRFTLGAGSESPSDCAGPRPREVCRAGGHLAANRFVLRTDVKSYYASIDHLMLLDQLAVHITSNGGCGGLRAAVNCEA